jgi:hypothetical protein
MRADVLVGPSPWVVERFGARVAGDLWTAIPEALRTAVARAVSAQPHARTATDRLLPNPRWPLPYEEIVLGLGGLPGAQVIRSPKSVYQLVVLRGQILLPWWYGPSGATAMRDVPPGRSFGRLARELLRRFGAVRRTAYPQLPLVRDERDERDVAHICAELAALDRSPAVLLAGFAATADHGLLRAGLGQVSSDTGGWRYADDLPLPAPVIPRPRRMQFP